MGMNFDDEQLMISLVKFVSGNSVQFQFVDLYGNNKPSQLFDTTATDHHHVFTQLKKKKTGNGKNFNRGIVGGGGSWKGIDNSRPVYDKKKTVIGFKKTFRFEEKNHVWIMKEYRLCDKIFKALRLRGHTPHEEEFVVCRITRSVNSSQVSDHKVENFVDSLLISSSQCQDIFAQNQFQDLGQSQFQELGQFGAVSAQSQFQENLDFGQLSTANVIPSHESNSIMNGNIAPVSLVFKESKLCAAIEEECSVHQQTPSLECSDNDIANYHKQLDAYAASVLESTVPYILQQQEDEIDSIPPFNQDFYIGHTNNVIPCGLVSLVLKESNGAAAKEEEGSVCPDYDIATYQKQLEEELIVCRITRKVNSGNFLGSCSSQCQETEIQCDHELNNLLAKESNGTQLPPAAIQEECSVPLVHQETPSVKEVECSVRPDLEQFSTSNVIPCGPVSLVFKESKLCAAIEEECSVPQQTPSVSESDYDIATYHKELDAYAASILETMVPYIPAEPPQEEVDSIPLFSEDFYIGHTNLWSYSNL